MYEYAVAYVDDILVFNPTWAQHMQHPESSVVFQVFGRFVLQVATLAAPLIGRGKVSQPVAWTEQAARAFIGLKEAICT